MGSPDYRSRFCPLKQKVIVLIPMSVRVWGSVRDGEALHDSVPSWQHSLWPDTGGRGKRAKEEEGNGGAERGGAGSICKAECESPQGEGRRGEDCAVEGELDPSQWLISLPAWSEWPRGLSPLRRRKDCRQEEEEEDCGSVEAPPGRLLAEGEEEGLGQAGMCQTCTHTRTHTNRG